MANRPLPGPFEIEYRADSDTIAVRFRCPVTGDTEALQFTAIEAHGMYPPLEAVLCNTAQVLTAAERNNREAGFSAEEIALILRTVRRNRLLRAIAEAVLNGQARRYRPQRMNLLRGDAPRMRAPHDVPEHPWAEEDLFGNDAMAAIDRANRAEARAQQLLEAHLSATQLQEFRGRGAFTVRAPGFGLFRISRVRIYNVMELRTGLCFCANFPDLPLADQMLGQKLFLENNPTAFFRVANREPLPGPMYQGR